MTRSFSVTTPIYYVNAEPHIGHAYTTIVADTLARYHRLAGDTTYALTGTDEHGEKVAQVAAERGIAPKALVDEISGIFRSTWSALGLQFDRVIRTTDPDHVSAVQRILQQVYDAGQIEFREYDGLYCVGCERFLTDRDMEEGLCRDHEREPERRSEANYFFLMSRHFEWLVSYIQENPDFIRPERYRNEVLAMLREESGLEDLCISRPKTRLEWGIELPFDDKFVCYVWFDALINYLSGLGYPDDPEFERRWSGVEHLVAKDILKPHGIFWPTMLRAAGLPMPRHLNVHGYWTMEARKISKSLGNKIEPLAMRDRYGLDAFRYFLLREMSFGLDANFTEDGLVARNNADLANNLGNLVSRTLRMTARFADGRVPELDETGELEADLARAFAEAADGVDTCVRRLEFHRALEMIFKAVDATNRYLDQRAPWKAAKDPERADEVRTCLYTTCQALRGIALLLAPFLPESAAAILERLGIPDALEGARLPDDARHWDRLAPGTPTTQGSPLFPRFEDDEKEASRD